MQKTVAGDFMTRIAEALKKEYLSDKKEYLQNELKSLGIEPNGLQNDINDRDEGLQALAESIKSVYYQAYKTAYSDSSNGNNNNNNSGRLVDSRTA